MKTQIQQRRGLRDGPLGQNKWRASLSVQSHITDASDVVVSTKTHHSCSDFNLNTPGNHIMGERLLQIVNSNFPLWPWKSYVCMPVCACECARVCVRERHRERDGGWKHPFLICIKPVSVCLCHGAAFLQNY